MHQHRPRTSASVIMLPLIVTFAVAVVACQGKTADQAVDTASKAAAPAVVAAADTAGCGFVPKMVHPRPDGLLLEFLKRDTEGEFTTTSAWRDEAMACPLHAPGWDGFTLISAVSTAQLSNTADTVRFLITYTRAALLEQDSLGYFIKPDVGTEIDTLKVGRSEFGWRIADWDQEPHLLPAGALKLTKLKDADRKKLTQEMSASSRAR